MKTYECPKCHVQVTCIGVVVGHACPSNQSKWVGRWIEVQPSATVRLRTRPRQRLVRQQFKTRAPGGI